MANIDQTINVLQAMLLTKDEQMIKTPTFYFFKMYKVHQDATLLPIRIECEEYIYDSMALPAISVSSASKDRSGNINVSLANINPNKDVEIDLNSSSIFSNVKGEIITSPNMNDYNDFGVEEKVSVSLFNGFELDESLLKITMPSKSVVTLTIN